MESKNKISDSPKIKSKLTILNKMNISDNIETKKIIKCILEYRKRKTFLNLSRNISIIAILVILSLN